MKKLIIIGVVALVVACCVFAAGCTTTTTTTTTTSPTKENTEDFIVGTWTMNDGTILIINNDFTGVQTVDDQKIEFTWNKIEDGKYELIAGNGVKTSATLDENKRTMTNAAGKILTKV